MAYIEGQILQITIPLQNNGSIVATNTVVSVVIPSGLVYNADVPSQGTYAAGTWTVGELIVAQSETLVLDLEVTDSCDAPFTISWSVTADQADPIIPNNSSSYIFSDDSCCEIKDCGQLYTSKVWVDSVYGSDTTGVLENRQKPFATLLEAFTQVKAHVSPTRWIFYVSGVSASETLVGIPLGTIIEFNSALVTDLTLSTGSTIYLKGELRSATGSNLIVAAGMDGKVVLNNALLITDGVTVPIDDSLVLSVTNINSSTNSITGFANVTFVHETLNVIPSLI